MDEKYLYNGKVYQRSQLESLAKQSNVSFNEYVSGIGAKPYKENTTTKSNDSEKFVYNGKDYSREQINELATQSNVSFDEYIKGVGVKKKDGITPLSDGTAETPPSPSPSKSTFGGSNFSLDPTNLLNKEQEEPLLPQPRKREITPANLKEQKSFEQDLFGVSKYGTKTLRIDRGRIVDGVEAPEEIEIDPRTIPVSPYKNVTDDVFLGTIRYKLLQNQPLSKQEESFIRKNQNPVSKFTSDDDNLLQGLSGELGLAAEAIRDAKVPDLIGSIFPQIKGKTFGDIANSNEGKYSQIQTVKEKIKRDIEIEESKRTGEKGETSDYETLAKLNSQLEDITTLEKKVSRRLATVGEAGVEGISRTDNTGSNWERFKKSAANLLFMGSAFIPEQPDEDIELKVSQLPSQLITGLNYTKYAEPVEFERVSRALAQGKPISETQIANLTNIGIDIEKERLKEDYNELKIDKPTFDAKSMELSIKAYDNLVGNKEVLRGLLSSGIADVLDEIEKTKIQSNVGGSREFGQVFGMRWQYTDEEIDYAAKVVAKANGLNIDDPRVKEAIQYLQDNEGAMIMQNSISKSGFTRDFFKGAAMPIRGIAATIEGVGKTSEEIYAEGQSQGNVNVSETPVKRIANSWEGTVGKVFEGAGQLGTQIGLSYLTGGAIGGAGKAILGRGGVAALEADIALADMAAADLAGAGLYKGREFISTFMTSFGTTYDGKLKEAQTYTADDGKAMAVAGGLAGMEGVVETFLSPLDIARGVGKGLFGKSSTEKLINILDDTKILDKKSAIQEYLTGTLKAGFASGKMVASEIGEEQVIALSDYGANAILNPNSESFKNRVLKDELLETGIQTGLSMAIPALFTGVGAFNTNNFAKGSLVIAAQNRQMMVDALDKNLADGLVTQEEYNKKLQIVNSASKANQELPLKADGSKLNSEEKANYIFSRVSEGALERKIEVSTDEAEKTILRNKVAEQQKSRETILNTPTNVQSQTTQNVSTQAQNNQGQQGQDNQTQDATPTQNAPIVAEPTEAQILDDIKNKRFATFTYDKEEDVPEVFKDRISSRGEINGVPFVRVTVPQSRADYEISKAAPKKEAEVVIDEEAVGVLEGLAPTEKLSDFEITMLKGSPKLAYEMIADQALGFGRVNGVRQPIPEAAAGTNEASVREKYGDAVVDKALQLFPLQTIKTNINENQKSNTEGVLGGVREEGNKNEGGQDGQQLRQGQEEIVGEPEIITQPIELKPFDTTESIDRRTVAELRAEEQKELAAAIPNIESYKVDGKVDKTLITDPTELATYNEIFDRYDGLITPKIREEKAAIAANPALKDVESTVKALEALYDKGESIIIKDKDIVYDTAETINFVNGKKVKSLTASQTPNVYLSFDKLAERYHDAKSKGIENDLTKAVESILSKEQIQSTLKTEKDAIQEQTAGQVPLQSRATVGETMEEGIPQAESQSVAQEGEAKKEVEQQIEDFGVAKKDVGAVFNVISKVFDSLKKGGLTALKNVGEWVGIGKGDEKTYALKIDGKEIQVRSLGVDVVNGFYSPLEKIIKESKADKLPAKQWSEKYANSEEARVTGLKDWLSKQEGSVSKADIQQYLKDNRIEISEIVKGELTEKEIKERDRLLKELNDIGVNKTRSILDGDKVKQKELEEKENELFKQLKPLSDRTNQSITKFSQYQLEGEKENYKEVLVTLPSKNLTKPKDARYKELIAEQNRLEKEYNKYDDLSYSRDEKTAKEATTKREEISLEMGGISQELDTYTPIKENTKFKSSHYDEPNILVHLRMNTRTAADGSKVLFLEEVQSDFGQEGKKRGFINKEAQAEIEELTQKSYRSKQSDYVNSLKEKYNVETPIELDKVVTKEEREKWGELSANPQRYSLTEAEQKRLDKLKEQEFGKGNAIQPAPFVTDTNSWVKLGLKVALKEAVKQGADKIAWTTGEQQNDRYDLSKQVDEVNYYKTESGSYSITADKNGTSVSSGIYKESELEGILGKEVAKRIIDNEGEDVDSYNSVFGYNENGGNQKYKSLRGGQLSVGGKGMKGFYGSPTEKSLGIVGNVAKSLFKQEPKTVEIASEKVISGDGITPFYQSDGEAVGKRAEKTSTQYSIDITPELKASVEDGLPLFKKGESEKDFGGFQTRDGKPIGYTYDTDKVARERFEISKLKKIGSGSDRDVYDLGDGRVLKIAKTARGLTQNIYEGDYYLKGIIPEVTERGLNYVVAENTPSIKSTDIVPTYTVDGDLIEGNSYKASEMLDELQQFSQKDFDNRVSKLQDVLYKYGLYDIMNYDVLWGDFIAKRNWGYKDGKAYHSDGGTFGGVDMITSYRGKTNMSDPEFRKIYEESKRLKKEFGDMDKATMYKEEEGKVQAQYRIESGKNVVEAIEEFNGSPRAVVALTHEIMHPTVVAIIDGVNNGNEVGIRHTQTIVDEFNKANPDNTITTEELVAGNEEFKQGTTTKKYRDVQEFVAENWEKYHTEGAKGFSKAFQEVLEQISKAFQAVYSTIKGEQLTPELRQMFDEILGKDQTTNNGATATATNQPVSTTEGATQQQGGQEAVQQGTTDAGQGGAVTTPTIRPTVKRLASDGTELVTLSGLTEEERQDKIAERKKKTSVSERVVEEQALLDDIKAYEALMNGNRGKTSPQGLAQLNRLRNRIAEYNRKYNSKYRFDDRRGVLRGNTGKSVKRIAIDSEKAIVDGQVLSDRSPKTQKIFQELFSASAMPTAYMANGIRMSAAQLDGVIDDIVDGIPSRRATNYLNRLENQIEQDDFDFSKSGSESQESRPKTPLSFVLDTEFEFVGEPMTQEALESWLADEADLEPEFEQIVTDNIDNLITDYEQEGATTASEEPIPATEAKDSGKPKQDSKEGGKGKDDKPKPSPKPKPSEPDAKEPDAVKKARDKKIEDFNNKVDANAKALIDFLTPKGMEGVKKSGLGVAEIVNNASKIIKAAYATSQNIKDAVQKGIDYFIANWDETELGELPVEALRQKLEAEFEVETEKTVKEVADDIRNDKISYPDAIEGKSDTFIAELDKELYGSSKFSFEEQAFKENVRRQKMAGLTEKEISDFYEALKKLTKRQKEIISEVFLETAQSDKMAKELQEAFASLAEGQKPKSVLERLAVSDVAALVNALKNALTYKAISNKQLEEMADFIVNAIDLKDADKYLNALISREVADVRQLVRAKLIVKLQDLGNNELATQLINEMADEATLSGRQTQSLIKAYEILNAKGNPSTKAAFQKRYADAVQKQAREMNKDMSKALTDKEVEIGRLNERLHQATQKSSAMSKLKEVIAKLCGLRNK